MTPTRDPVAKKSPAAPGVAASRLPLLQRRQCPLVRRLGDISSQECCDGDNL
jgi:hypothetical protein